MHIADRLIGLFEAHGDHHYGETVTQTEHAVQSAALAERDDGSATLIVAALLHDIGHFLHPAGDRPGHRDHAERAADFLTPWYPDAVTEPIRLHIAAKRYLCARERGYWEQLSDASKQTLVAQGGPFSSEEAAAFSSAIGANDAIRLRRFDDDGKIEGLILKPLAHYLPLLRALSQGGEQISDAAWQAAYAAQA